MGSPFESVRRNCSPAKAASRISVSVWTVAPASLVVANLGDLVVDVFRIESIERGEPSRVMQQANSHDHLAAQIRRPTRHHPLEPLARLDLVGIFDCREFLIEAKLHERLDGLSIRALRELVAGDAIGKARDVDNPLVRVEKLRLATRSILGLDDERGERPVRGRQSGREARGAGPDNHDIPVTQAIEIERGLERLDAEIRHAARRSDEIRPAPFSSTRRP